MISPDKYTNLDFSVLNISAAIVSLLQKKRLLQYEELKAILEKKMGKSVESVFLPSLTFLYSIGLIEYWPKTDSIEMKR